jgi:hypothetical protein
MPSSGGDVLMAQHLGDNVDGVGFFSSFKAIVAQARRKQCGVTREVMPFTASIPGVAFLMPMPARIPCQVAIFVTVDELVLLPWIVIKT